MKGLFTLNTDKDGYILSISHTKDDSIELDLTDEMMKYLPAYRYINGKISVDEARKEELIEIENQLVRKDRIEELRKLLTESDDIMGGMLDDMASLTNPVTFISDFIKLIGDMNSKYAELIVQRKAWREELESLLK